MPRIDSRKKNWAMFVYSPRLAQSTSIKNCPVRPPWIGGRENLMLWNPRFRGKKPWSPADFEPQSIHWNFLRPFSSDFFCPRGHMATHQQHIFGHLPRSVFKTLHLGKVPCENHRQTEGVHRDFPGVFHWHQWEFHWNFIGIVMGMSWECHDKKHTKKSHYSFHSHQIPMKIIII